MTTPRLFDCFPFYNEMDVLELRLAELDPLVHRFVLVESTVTQTGKPKALFYQDNKARYAAWAHKIIHVVVDDMPHTDAWARENHQRRAILRGLGNAQPGDAILISDLDEIPRPAVLRQVLSGDGWRDQITIFQTAMFVYSLNLAAAGGGPVRNSWGQSPRLMEGRRMHDPQVLRRLRVRHKKDSWLSRLQEQLEVWRKFGPGLSIRRVPNAAWHFTYIGDRQFQLEKLEAMAHEELATPVNMDVRTIEQRLASRSVVFNQNIKLSLQPLDEKMPMHLRENPDKFRHLLAQ